MPTGYIFVTRGLLESLETEHELAAILAHEIAHVESRHSFRQWRNSQRAAATDNVADDIAAAMTAFTAQLFMAGHGRDREREADLFASFYLNNAEIGDRPLLSSFRKLKFARDAHDPFGQGSGLFASDEVSAVFGDDEARGLIEGPIEAMELKLRNVDRWERADDFSF